MAEETTEEQPRKKPDGPVLEGGTYEIIRKRLQDHAADLRARLGKLNDLRKDVFGSIETVLLRADRITTEHNCVPRDMAPLEDNKFLFGYNVQFGLKTSIKLSDVFACYEFKGENFQETNLAVIGDERFADDFQSLYKYYKNTRFVKFSYIGPYFFMVFRVGNDVTDEVLARTFGRYASFQRAKVVRCKKTNKTRGYGFVSFREPADFTRAMKEINGKYVGSRPIKLRKSNWKDRNIDVVRQKQKIKQQMGYKWRK